VNEELRSTVEEQTLEIVTNRKPGAKLNRVEAMLPKVAYPGHERLHARQARSRHNDSLPHKSSTPTNCPSSMVPNTYPSFL
jgi:hypothetical protein